MLNLQEWLNESTRDGLPRHERICFLLEANSGPNVHQWGILSYGDGHQRGLEQDDALELMQVTAFLSGLEAMGAPVGETLAPLIYAYRARHERPNVEVTGAARLYRAASRERSERGRPPGYASVDPYR